MYDVGNLHLAPHIEREPVRPKPDGDALLQHLEHWRNPNRIIHVRFGIMDDLGAIILQHLDLAVIDMDAMDRQRFRPEDT